MRCNVTCKPRIDKRTQEVECLVHGTISFVRRAHDRVEHEPNYNPYSPEYLLKVAEFYAGRDLGEAASDLGISRSTMYQQVKIAKRKERAASNL